MESLLNFTKLIYSFYPLGLCDENSEEYKTSKEFQNLLATKTKNIDTIKPEWENLLKNLIQQYGKINVTTFDYYLSTSERSFPVCIIIENNTAFKRVTAKNIVLHISTLIPYFTIYTSNSENFSALNELSSTIILPDLMNEYIDLKKRITTFFPKFKEFPKEFILKTIPNIMYMGIGVLDQEELNLLPDLRKEMTMYNALFSDAFYYNYIL